MKYKIKNVTPESMTCLVSSCHGIYKGLREITPQEMDCGIGLCPIIYRSEGKEVYLIVGKLVNPSEAGLEKKVGEGEALIEVPRKLIDEMKK